MRVNLPESRHFRLEGLADGVYGVIARDGGWAIANAGIIDLGDRTLVFDTLMTPTAAADLRGSAKQLTGRDPSLLVNSHYHNDHIWGNQAFGAADIVATSRTRSLIMTSGQKEMAWFSEHGQTQLEELREQYRAETDKQKQVQTGMGLAYYEAIVGTLPLLEVRLPNLTFEDRFLLHGSERGIELFTYGGGHTGSDAMLYLPEEKVLFMADLLFVESHPYLSDGDPYATQDILDKVKELKPEILVPGHGPVGTVKDLAQMQQYIRDLDAMAAEMVAAGEPVEKAGEWGIPDPYLRWQLGQFFIPNLRFLWGLHSRAAKG